MRPAMMSAPRIPIITRHHGGPRAPRPPFDWRRLVDRVIAVILGAAYLASLALLFVWAMTRELIR